MEKYLVTLTTFNANANTFFKTSQEQWKEAAKLALTELQRKFKIADPSSSFHKISFEEKALHAKQPKEDSRRFIQAKVIISTKSNSFMITISNNNDKFIAIITATSPIKGKNHWKVTGFGKAGAKIKKLAKA